MDAEDLAEVRCAGWWSVDRGRPNERRATVLHTVPAEFEQEKQA